MDTLSQVLEKHYPLDPKSYDLDLWFHGLMQISKTLAVKNRKPKENGDALANTIFCHTNPSKI